MRLDVIDAHCGYGSDAVVQSFVNFHVESGDICCVLGPNGCGKSTLFKSVLGLLPLVSGQVQVDGQNIASWSPRRMAQVFGYVAQSHVPPFPYQVKDIVLLGRMGRIGYLDQPSEEDYVIAEQAMEATGIYHLREKMYTEISGGELQLAMIARALCQQPQVLVLDEPTASLDYGNVVRVIHHVRELAQSGLAVIMTTHSPDHAFMCNSNVVLLQRDNPVVFGPAVEVITERNMQQAYGVNIRIVEFVNSDGEIMRMCAPLV